MSLLKYLRSVAGLPTESEAITTSAGAADAGKLVGTGAGGRLDESLLPDDIGEQTVEAEASEALAARDLVNIFHDGASTKVRKADASDGTKPAQGFVTAGVTMGDPATVHPLGVMGAGPAAEAGVAFLSATPGAYTDTAPSAAGNAVQRVGVIVGGDPSALVFQPMLPVVLASE